MRYQTFGIIIVVLIYTCI